MSSTIDKFKRGTSLSYGCFVVMPAGTWAVASKLRDIAGNFIDNIDVTLTPPVSPETRYTLTIARAASATSAWPLGKLLGDILFTDSSSTPIKLATGNYVINVVDLQTR